MESAKTRGIGLLTSLLASLGLARPVASVTTVPRSDGGVNVMDGDRLTIYVPGQSAISYELIAGAAATVVLMLNAQPIAEFPNRKLGRNALMQLGQVAPQSSGRVRRWGGRVLLAATFFVALAGSILVVHGVPLPQPVASRPAGAAGGAVPAALPSHGTSAGVPALPPSEAAGDSVISLDGVSCAMFGDELEG